ncbi:MAG TPA: PQQ-dependent dehydrogenase, methanol/ethanol family [Steroidobacteraceae bacterium]|nr:PQQ-dependent dehydrogenase, methanol/ethanol family [Steroidobacteraceae bacterium]
MPRLIRNGTALLLGICCLGAAAAADQTTAPGPADAAPPAPAAAVFPGAPRPAAAVDEKRLIGHDPNDWLTVGGSWSEQRFSPLKLINAANAHRLGLAWFADLGTYRGVEASPLVIDGVLYNISAWDITTAYDAATGRVLWRYDPKVAPEYSRIACCGPVSRGLAAWRGRIFIGALDGRLIALDAATGKPLWSTQTLDPGEPLSITGAPRIADGLVVIGNSGGDFGGRGYVSAYDAETGRQVWKFYIVPGDPAKGPEGLASDSVSAMAAKTWTGQWWKTGGGGNAWDGISYDPLYHRVYIATGNGSPHPEAFRSPGGGDNLFLCSILALDARSGHYAWHYQEIPGEEWDYDCTNPMILADLKIGGRVRHVILHAPKDGFFYVVDRATGRLISAAPYVPSTWASRVDLRTGRPVINADAYVAVKPHLLTPGYGGGHNWNPMSFSPLTGLVYIPAQQQWMVESRLPDGQFKFVKGQSTLGAGVLNYPELRKQLNAEAARREKGYMLAWDPVHQREAFRIPYPHPGNGGTLVTAGNLLVQGTINETLAVYRADDGRKLWEMPVQSVPVAGPVSYEVGGVQYIAVNVGWNSAIVAGLSTPEHPFSFSPARLMVFALDAHTELPPAPPSASISPPPMDHEPPQQVRAGALLYSTYCAICHGQNAVGGVRDLRYLTPERHAQFNDIVLGGKLRKGGMESFRDKLSPDQVAAIHAYLIQRAQDDWQPDFTRPRRK